MATWSEFSAAAPELALDIRDLVHQYGPGLGYLATVRPDGGPRVHPVSPVITDDGLYCFLIRSPKRADLLHDDRYALHAFPPEHADDEAYLSGRATPVTDGDRRAAVVRAYHATPRVDWCLFEFTVEVAMLGRYSGRGLWPPRYTVWRDPDATAPVGDPGLSLVSDTGPASGSDLSPGPGTTPARDLHLVHGATAPVAAIP